MRTITETWAAGQTKEFPIQGGRFEIMSAQYPVDVSFQDANGTELTNGRAQDIGAGSYRQAPFGRIAITSSQAQQITFLISNGDAGTRSIAGTVQVVDGGKARTLAGNSFVARPAKSGAAGLYTHVQLQNPAGSGKRLIVTSMMVSSADATNWAILIDESTVLATVENTIRHKGGGGVSVAVPRTETRATVLASPIYGGPLQAGSPFVLKFDEPFVVLPAKAMTLATLLPDTDLSVSFEFFEEAI